MNLKQHLRVLTTSIAVTAVIGGIAVAVPFSTAFACSTQPQQTTTRDKDNKGSNPTPAPKPTPKPVVSFSCSGMDVTNIDRTHFDLTAHASVQNATVISYVFTTVNSKGAVVDTTTVTTSALSATYHFNQTNAGSYTVSAVINTDHGSTKGVCDCSKVVIVKTAPVTPPVQPPVVTPATPVTPVTPAATVTPATPVALSAKTLPNTGPGDMAELFVGTSAFGGIGHFLNSRRRRF